MPSDRRQGGLPLAVYIVALLIVPLGAVALFGSREISRNNELVSTTTRLADLVELRAASATFRAPLQVDRLANLGLTRLHELGVDPEPVVALTGLDFAKFRADNQDRLDAGRARLIDAVSDDRIISADWRTAFIDASRDLDEAIARVGTDDAATVGEIDALYDRTGQMLDGLEMASAAEAAFLDPPSVREAEVVSRVIAVSDVATTAAEETELVGDFVLGVTVPTDAVLDAASHHHRDALDTIGVLGSSGSTGLQQAYAALDPINTESYGDIGDERATDEPDPAVVLQVAGSLLQRVDYLEEVSAFALAESGDAVAVVDQARRSAVEDNWRTLLTFGAVGLLSVGFGVIVIRSFARPLAKLRTQAARIGQGEMTAEPLDLDGPSDIRRVTGAVNEMAATLALVDDQLQSLALSDFDGSTDLAELPGKVGASMRNSVERITALTVRLRASEARLAEEARIDMLTGLPNRFAVLEYLGQCVERSENGPVWPPPGQTADANQIGVMFLDVDGFKSVNDTHGHAVGDVVLREIAQRLRRSVRDIDFVARLGGDEFLVVIDGLNDREILAIFGERLIGEIEQPYVVGDQLFAVSASVGATIVQRGDDALSAIERADAAVYQAKRRGRRRVEMFDQRLQDSIEQQAELELALRQAIRHDELRIHLQPLADLQTGCVAGAEVLVRWERPGVGLLPPGDFIPIAERSGLIFDLERWVLHAACRRVADWRRRGVGAGMRLAVNISGRHLTEGGLLAALDAAIESSGADPNLLEIELTETHLLDDVERAESVLGGIRARGIRVAIDDFGTGYSSMTYLQRLPVDIVKIDRSFVNSAATSEFDSTVIESVVTISSALSLEIVAEGIETQEQLDYVIGAGCTYGQGFYLARPMPVDEAEHVMFGGPLFPQVEATGDRLAGSTAVPGSGDQRGPED